MGRISPTRQPDLAAPTPQRTDEYPDTEKTLHHAGVFVSKKVWVMRSRFLGFAALSWIRWYAQC